MAATPPRTADDPPRGSDPLPGEAQANRAVMDRIGTSFDETRKEAWAPVVAFLEGLPEGARVLDLAGGNGRHARAAHDAGLLPVLVDVSGVLVRLARQNAAETGFRLASVEGDAGALPFRDGAFDAGLYVAGLHCVRARTARLRTLAELRRVVRPGGRMLVTVWSAEQDRFRGVVAGQRRAATTDSISADMEVGDVLVPWTRGMEAPVERFFHVYSEGELRRDLEDAHLHVERIDGVTLTKSAAPDNWFAVVRNR